MRGLEVTQFHAGADSTGRGSHYPTPHTREKRAHLTHTHAHPFFVNKFPCKLERSVACAVCSASWADASEMISKPNFSSLSPPVYWSSCAPTVFAPDAHRNSAPLPGTFCQWASLPNLEKQETTLTFGEGEVRRWGGGRRSQSLPPSPLPAYLPASLPKPYTPTPYTLHPKAHGKQRSGGRKGGRERKIRGRGDGARRGQAHHIHTYIYT